MARSKPILLPGTRVSVYGKLGYVTDVVADGYEVALDGETRRDVWHPSQVAEVA